MGFGNSSKGKWIDLVNEFLHLLHFITGNNTVDNLEILLAIEALTLKEGYSTIQLIIDSFSQFCRFAGNDKESFAGKGVFEANPLVVEKLQEVGNLLKVEKINTVTHTAGATKLRLFSVRPHNGLLVWKHRVYANKH